MSDKFNGFHFPELVWKFKKLHPDAKIPQRNNATDAGMDLRSIEDVWLEPGQVKVIGTGLAMKLPEGFEAQIRSRSGLAANNSVFVLNSPGTIDANYTGEIKVILMNAGSTPLFISKGDRIAQLVLGTVVFLPNINIVDELEETDRGTNGLGSSGVK